MPLNDATVGTFAYGFGVGTLPQHYGYRTQKDRLSGTGFSRNNGEARREIDLDTLDKCEIAYYN